MEEEIVLSHPRIIRYFNDNPELDPGLVPLLYRIFRQDREQHLRQNGHHEQTNAVEHRRD
jgi:hypothetical protein